MGAELERTCTVPGDSAAVSGLEFHYPGWTSGPVVFVFCLAYSGVRRAFCYLNRHDHFQSTIRVFRDGAGVRRSRRRSPSESESGPADNDCLRIRGEMAWLAESW